MKIGEVHMPSWNIPGIILEDVADFNEYVDFASKEIELGVRSVFHSAEPVERWDHICRDPSMFNAMFHLSFQECSLNGGNPLLKLDDIINRKYRGMLKALLEGYVLVVNNVGGWCTASKERGYTIFDSAEYQPPLHYYIAKPHHMKGGTLGEKESTKFINLENDPNLEEYTRRELYKIDPNYSCVKNMIHWRKEDFIKVFTEFKEAGGTGIWLYTTGLNVDQMYLYTDAAIEVGLTEFIFKFKSYETENHIDFINHYKDNESINFSYEYV